MTLNGSSLLFSSRGLILSAAFAVLCSLFSSLAGAMSITFDGPVAGMRMYNITLNVIDHPSGCRISIQDAHTVKVSNASHDSVLFAVENNGIGSLSPETVDMLVEKFKEMNAKEGKPK